MKFEWCFQISGSDNNFDADIKVGFNFILTFCFLTSILMYINKNQNVNLLDATHGAYELFTSLACECSTWIRCLPLGLVCSQLLLLLDGGFASAASENICTRLSDSREIDHHAHHLLRLKTFMTILHDVERLQRRHMRTFDQEMFWTSFKILNLKIIVRKGIPSDRTNGSCPKLHNMQARRTTWLMRTLILFVQNCHELKINFGT